MARPSQFEGVSTVASEACAKALGEGRALLIDFITYRNDEVKRLGVMLTFHEARDLALSIITAIGGTPEIKSMRILKGVLDALNDINEGTCATPGAMPEPSSN